MSLRRSSRITTTTTTTTITTTSMPPPPLPAPTSPIRSKTQKRAQMQPATPPASKRRKASESPTLPTKPPPLTPTPSAIGLIAASHNPSATDDADSPPSPLSVRPAEPHMTNAPLKTPRGSRVVATPRPLSDNTGPTSRNGETTTENLLEKACAHLISVDPRLKPLIEKHRCKTFAPEGLAEEIDPFQSLASSIMAQQVSGAAATSIKNKFIALFHPPTSSPSTAFPTPQAVSTTPLATLRLAGLSQRKAEYIQGLASKFASGELTAQMLAQASDDEILETLTKVRGLGRWSVEMFACFALKRMDVFSTGDLGVQRGMAAYTGRNVAKLKAKGGGKWKYMSEQEMLDVSAKFAPYRSLFMWYMWRIEDVDISAMGGVGV